MKVYVASSWRNQYQPEVVQAIKDAEIGVYDFRHPDENDGGFHWSQIDPGWKDWTPELYRKNLRHPIAQNGFDKDMKALDECDVVVLVLPCGRSAHLEFGYSVGQGKRGAIFISEPIEPELMYKMAKGIFTDLNSLIDWLNGLKQSDIGGRR